MSPSGAERRAIGLIAKGPVPGAVKTRLAFALGDEIATRLYSAFLRDALLVAGRVSGASTTAFHPADSRPGSFRRIAPPGISFAPDAGGDLGSVMEGAISRLLGGGANLAALIGADVPLLTPGEIESAFAVLESGGADVVVGPSEDGGYHLIAMDTPQPELFSDVDWGTERVLEQTLELAAGAGLRVRLLDRRYDVDDLANLQRLAADLASDGSLAADATRSALHALSQEGIDLLEASQPWQVRRSRTP